MNPFDDWAADDVHDAPDKPRFLGRPIFDANTSTYVYADGSGRVPVEMKKDLELAFEQRTHLGCNGVAYLGTLFWWKDRLKLGVNK